MNSGDAARPLIILGCGYTGKHVFRLALERGVGTWATSRRPARHLAGIPVAQRLEFELTRPDTWEHLISGADLIWCFPAAPLAPVQEWAERQRSRFHRLIILGSTSAYDVPHHVAHAYPPPWTDETALIDRSKPRVQGEEYLRTEHGGTILRVAGIYGPDRNPTEWIRRGNVRPSEKYVNLIHVKDLAEICLLARERAKPGDVYNVSDGTPRTWKEIYENAAQPRGIIAPAAQEARQPGKRISTAKLRESFGPVIRHPDLYTELAHLDRI